MTKQRNFLFLQGPQSKFFRQLGIKLSIEGHKVIKVNFCGGDLMHWSGSLTRSYRGFRSNWPDWLSRLFKNEDITDMMLFGDRRPFHTEAILLAKQKKIKIHVFEEGYLRPAYVTMEQGGVNGRSGIPDSPDKVRQKAESIKGISSLKPLTNPLQKRVTDAILHHLGNTIFFPFFPLHKTHRPYPILWELKGWIPRYFSRKKRTAKALKLQSDILNSNIKYFLFPLQLDSDFQIKAYSEFTDQVEAIATVMHSFASSSPSDCHLIIKNHPLDNGLISYAKFISSFARALGIKDRIFFLDGGIGGPLMKNSQAVVLVNSTMGLEALTMGIPVYCMGQAIYSMQGLACSKNQLALDQFWTAPVQCDRQLLNDFIKILHKEALIYGNFYTDQGIKAAVQSTLKRLEIP